MNTLKLTEEQMMLVELTPINIRESALPNSVKVVLGNLYFLNGRDYAKENGCVYRSNADMANDCQISKPTLITAIRQLDILGFIERDKGKRNLGENGKPQATVYRLKKDIVESYKIEVKMKNKKNNGLSLKNETLPPNFTTNEAIKLLVNELVEIKNELKEIRLSLNGLSLKNETLPPNFTHTENQLVTTMGKVSTSGKDCSNFTTDTDTESDTSIITSTSVEGEDKNKKRNYVNNDSLAFPCAGACEENAETNLSELDDVDNDNVNSSNAELPSTNSFFSFSSSESLSANDNVKSSNVESSSSSFFSLSQDSLPATEITSSTGGEEKKSSTDNTENASGDAGEALNSSVDTCTTSTPIVQPDAPETPNLTRPDKTTTDRILKILNGRDIYTYVGDFKAWASTANDVSPEMIAKIERKMTFLKENGIGKPSQWKMVEGLILKLKNKKGSTYKGGGATDKVDFNILREYVGKVWDAKPETKSAAIDSLDKFRETFDRYMNSDISEEQREILTSIQDNMIKACAVKRYDIGCEHKELRYDNNDKEPSDVRLDKCWSVLYAKSNIKSRERFKELYKEKYGSYDGSLKLYEQLAKKKYGDKAYNNDIVGMLQNNW